MGSLLRRARALLSEELEALLVELYPRACRLCGRGIEAGIACERHRLPELRGPRCGRCAARLASCLPDGLPCPACRRTPPPFARIVVLADYRAGALAQWILAIKHGGRRDLLRPLVLRLARKLEAKGERLLVPIPAHPLRRLERGLDSVDCLARECARQALGRVLRALIRVRHTPPQGAAGSPSRRANLRSAFRLDVCARRLIVGREVWLVDDVVTSGATVAEAARVLRRAGALRVVVLALARAGEGQEDEPRQAEGRW